MKYAMTIRISENSKPDRKYGAGALLDPGLTAAIGKYAEIAAKSGALPKPQDSHRVPRTLCAGPIDRETMSKVRRNTAAPRLQNGNRIRTSVALTPLAPSTTV